MLSCRGRESGIPKSAGGLKNSPCVVCVQNEPVARPCWTGRGILGASYKWHPVYGTHCLKLFGAYHSCACSRTALAQGVYQRLRLLPLSRLHLTRAVQSAWTRSTQSDGDHKRSDGQHPLRPEQTRVVRLCQVHSRTDAAVHQRTGRSISLQPIRN